MHEVVPWVLLDENHDVGEDSRSSKSGIESFLLELNHSEHELDSVKSLLTERDVVNLVDGALDCGETFVIGLQNSGNGSDLLLENVDQNSSLSGGRVRVTSLEIISGLIIAVLLDDHVIVFIMAVVLVFVSLLFLLLLSFDVVEDDLVENYQAAAFA